MTTDERNEGLLEWQLSLYPDGHADRANLLIHAATVPLFLLGSVAVVSSAALGWWLAPAGVAAMLVAVAAQGRGHAREATKPVPFRSAGDALARLFVEQWVTFPRFVLRGGFVAAWRAGGVSGRRSSPRTPCRASR
jgi:hypothetical protein